MNAGSTIRLAAACVVLTLWLSAQTCGTEAAETVGAVGTTEGITHPTKPSYDVKLKFLRPGRIAEMLVKEGDVVKQGQPLVQLDDKAEKIKLEELRATMEDMIQVKAAKAQREQAVVDHKKLQEGFGKGIVGELELEHAKLQATIAGLRHELANFDKTQAKRQYNAAEIEVGRMCLKSPIAGRVEEIYVRPGASVDALEEVIRVVRIDPLWIEPHAPIDQARKLRLGQSAEVRFPDLEEPVIGKVTFIAAVAEVQMLRVRIEVPNASGRIAGEEVTVFLRPAPKAAASNADKKNVHLGSNKKRLMAARKAA